MANGKEINNTKVLVGTVEQVIDPMLETIGGFTSDECVNAIKNKNMQNAVKAYARAYKSGRKSEWDRVKAIHKMNVDMRKEFGSDTTLAQFLGLKSKSEFSKLRRAGELVIEAEKKGIKTLPPVSVVCELLVAEGDKYGKQKLLPMLEKVASNEMSQRETREYVQTFKKKDDRRKANKGAGRQKEEKQKAPKPDTKGIVQGKVNESPLPELDTVLVWVNGKNLRAMSKEGLEQMVQEINTVLERFAIGGAVMCE